MTTTLKRMAIQTNSSQELMPIQIPALRAHIGDKIYYVTVLKMRDVAERVKVPQSKASNGITQRKSQERRANKIRDYLLEKPQRFHNTLIIDVCVGSPKWFELNIRDSNLFSSEDLSPHLNGMLGMLHFDGSEKLFAINGQHNVTGILKALEKNKDLENEEVSAIFISSATQYKVWKRLADVKNHDRF